MSVFTLTNLQTEIVDVLTGEVMVAEGNALLRCSGIGSCVCVVLIDPETGRSGMAHVMLPGSSPVRSKHERTKYAEDALNELVTGLKEKGSPPEQLIAVIGGGGNVLQKPDDTLCRMNVQSVKSILAAHGIHIAAESTGGTQRRALSSFTARGEVYCSEGDDPEYLLFALSASKK